MARKSVLRFSMLNETSDPLAFCRDMKRLRKPVRLSHRYHPPANGLWKVETPRKGVLGGFMIANGRVVRCSPKIRRHLHVLAARNAVFVGVAHKCLGCGRVMMYRGRRGARCCSPSCTQHYWNRRRKRRRAAFRYKTLHCLVCGREFEAARSDAKTCGPKCRTNLCRSHRESLFERLRGFT